MVFNLMKTTMPNLLRYAFSLLVLASLSAGAHAASLNLSNPVGGSQSIKYDGVASTISVSVNVTTAGDVAGLQFDIDYPAAAVDQGIEFSSIQLDPALVSLGFAVQSNAIVAQDGLATHKLQRVIVTPRNDNVALTGGTLALATIQFNVIANTVAPGTAVNLTNPILSTTNKQQLTQVSLSPVVVVSSTVTELANGATVPTLLTGDMLLRANGTYYFPQLGVAGAIGAPRPTMVIEGGATVYVPAQSLGLSSLLSVNVVAIGDPSRPIHFLPNGNGARPDDLFGYLVVSGGVHRFEYCTFLNFSSQPQTNTDGYVIRFLQDASGLISHSTFENNHYGIGLQTSGRVRIVDNRFINNQVVAISVFRLEPDAIGSYIGNVSINRNYFQPITGVRSSPSPQTGIGDNLDLRYLVKTSPFPHSENLSLDATNNYWGTTDLHVLRITTGSANHPAVLVTPYLDSNMDRVQGNFISGRFERDTTLAKHSEYIVDGDLIIPDGVTLTIEEGVTLRFSGSSCWAYSSYPGCSNLKSLIGKVPVPYLNWFTEGLPLTDPAAIRNEGTLRILGKPGSPVNLVARPSSYSSFLTGFAELLYTSGTAIIEHANIDGCGPVCIVQFNGKWSFGVFIQSDFSISDSTVNLTGQLIYSEVGNSTRLLRNEIVTNSPDARALSVNDSYGTGRLDVRGNTFNYLAGANDHIDFNNCENIVFERNNYYLKTNQKILSSLCTDQNKIDARNNWWGSADPALLLGTNIDYSGALALPVASPVANAGPDQSTSSNNILLNAKGTTDPDNNLDHCSWYSIIEGARTWIGDVPGCASTLAYTLPAAKDHDVFYFEVVAIDQDGFESRDIVHYIFGPAPIEFLVPPPPIANAGVDISATEGTLVTLDGSASAPANSAGRIVKYQWTQFSGPSVSLSQDARSSSATFIAPSVGVATALTFTLTVTDDANQVASDTVTISVQNLARLPVADAGVNRTVRSNEWVYLDGSRSYDPDGSIKSYVWSIVLGSGVVIVNPTSAQPSFQAPLVSSTTSIILKLTVVDTDNLSASALVTINVGPPAPIAGPVVTFGASPTTIASGSGSALTWSSTGATSCTASGGWAGAQATSGSQTVTPTVTTSYTLACTGTGGTTSQSATVTVTAAPVPTITFSASPTTIASGSSSTLIWSSTNSTSCMASGGWTGSKTTSGSQALSPTSTSTYTLACSGAGGTATQSTTISVSAAGTTTASIAAGYSRTLSLRPDGSVWQWGDGALTPFQIAGLANIKSAAAGSGYSLALDQNGFVWGWGSNSNGELGNNTFAANLGAPLNGAWSNVASIATGWNSTYAVKTDGTVWASGTNAFGQLGDNTMTNRATPVQVIGLSNVKSVAASAYHGLALNQDGTVWAWGTAMSGEFGDGNAGYVVRLTAAQITGLSNVVAISAGYLHSVALKSDGTVWEWGANGAGITSAVPVQVSGLNGVIAIDAGKGMHTLALKSDGTVWAWGSNGSGRLGDGTTTNRATPVQVFGLTGVTGIVAGYEHSSAIKSDGTVWAWGYNLVGRLGDGTTTDRLTPVQVVGLPSASGAPLPTLSFSANPTAVSSGQGSALTWTSTNTTNCIASDGWSGAKTSSGGETVSLTATSNYTLTCTGAGGSVNSTVVITVSATAAYGITVTPTTLVQGGVVHVAWLTPTATNGASDFVGLFVPGGTQEIYGQYKYTGGAQTGVWDFIPPAIGTFEVRYCLNNGYVCPAISGPIAVQ